MAHTITVPYSPEHSWPVQRRWWGAIKKEGRPVFPNAKKKLPSSTANPTIRTVLNSKIHLNHGCQASVIVFDDNEMGVQNLPECRWHLRIQAARRVTWNLFLTEDPKTSVATVHKSVAKAIWRPKFANPCDNTIFTFQINVWPSTSACCHVCISVTVSSSVVTYWWIKHEILDIIFSTVNTQHIQRPDVTLQLGYTWRHVSAVNPYRTNVENRVSS